MPVLVACEVIKLAPIHAREPGEDRFDLTPPECVDSYVTEEGVFTPAIVFPTVARGAAPARPAGFRQHWVVAEPVEVADAAGSR